MARLAHTIVQGNFRHAPGWRSHIHSRQTKTGYLISVRAPLHRASCWQGATGRRHRFADMEAAARSGLSEGDAGVAFEPAGFRNWRYSSRSFPGDISNAPVL